MSTSSLRLLLLLIFCSSVFAIMQPPQGSELCPPEDWECQREISLNVPSSFQDGIAWTDLPWLDTEATLERLKPDESLYSNDVYCWPSVGGMITAKGLHAVELAYIGLDRFEVTPRSTNQTEEDEFCLKLRKIGGKWWSSYYDFESATGSRVRKMWPDEREVLFLGWPEQGGVWVLRYDNPRKLRGDLGPIWNAFNMEERCMALEKRGAVFFENPEESEHVGPLLKGFGNREQRREPEFEDGGWWDHGYELWEQPKMWA